MRHRLFNEHRARCLSQSSGGVVTLGVVTVNRSWGGKLMEKEPYIKPVIEVEVIEPEALCIPVLLSGQPV